MDDNEAVKMDEGSLYAQMLGGILQPDEWHWSLQEPGTISLPEFIRKRAKGEAKMHNGRVFLKKPGPDLVQAKLIKGVRAAIKKKIFEAVRD